MSEGYTEVTCKTALSPSGLPGLDYSLNPYIGCGHGCVYCYAPSVLVDRHLAMNWGRVVKAKMNIVDVLKREVMRKPKGVVGVSTVCDPYHPAEEKLRLTRGCIEVLSEHGFKVSIQTKSGLVLRDADIIAPGKFDVGVTITTMDRGLAGVLEPGASPPDVRAKVLDEFSSRGVETWLFLGPIIPGVNDSENSIRQVLEVAARTRSKVIYDRLNLKRWTMDRLAPALMRLRPGTVEQQAAFLREGLKTWPEASSRVKAACRELGVECEAAFEG